MTSIYAIIRVHIDMKDPIPEVHVTGLDSDKDTLEFRMIEQFANFLGWDDLDDFMSDCEDIINEWKETGYFYHYDPEISDYVDYWTIREV